LHRRDRIDKRRFEIRFMKKVALSIALAALTFAAAAQQSKKPTVPVKNATAAAKPTPKPAAKTTAKKPAAKKDEKSEFEKATAIEDADKRAVALEKFLADFPNSESRSSVVEKLTVARVIAGEAMLDSGDREGGLKMLRKAIDDASSPYPEALFNESIGKVPGILLAHGEVQTANELALSIEKNAATNAAQLITLATFYLSTENGAEAKRLAEAAIKIDEKSAAAYQVLGMADRVNFDLDAAAAAYEKAVELEPESIPARQALGELKRATGKPDEAVTIFSSLLEKDPSDVRSINGRILALFDAGKRSDAEAELSKLIESEPNDFVLFAGASYWYAAIGENAKAIDLAGKAIAIEPRYIWSHIALARGLMGDGRATDAEQVLLKAKKYGNFPTLDYELAATKYAAGFYREAAEELQKSFAVKDGVLAAKLGRRVERTDKNFIDLLASERRASILAPKAADNLEQAERLRTLLELRTVLSEKSPDEAKLVDAASAFAAGTDKMRFHRQIFAAGELLDRSLAPSKALELSKAAVSSLDDGLSVSAPAAPLMAAELYASRRSAIANDKYVLVPDVPKQTLSAIARGRVEEIAGEALLLQKNNAEAVVRLRRAVSILPEKSAWWKSSYWRLGSALEADGKDKDALDAYVKSYTGGDPEATRYAVIENVYKRVNNGTEGLEALIGANPAKPAESAPQTSAPVVETKVEAGDQSSAEKKTENKVETSEIVPEKKTEPKPEPAVETVVEKKPELKVEQTIDSGADKKTEPVSEKKAETEPPKNDEIKSPPSVEKALEVPLPTPSPDVESKKPVEEKREETKPVVKEEAAPNIEETKQPLPEEQKPVDNNAAAKKEVSYPDVEKTESAKVPEAKPTPKPLFEPVIIEVKSSKSAKAKDMLKDESAVSTTNSEKESLSPEGRPRLVQGKEVAVDAPPPCTISVSQENISLIGGGGSVAVLVGSEGGDIKDIKAASSSSKDVEVVAEPEIAGVSGRALFVVRSLTANAGTYQVSFASPCGKKEISVRVR
jgi:tetratricopeptide (TPR) repeat protein